MLDAYQAACKEEVERALVALLDPPQPDLAKLFASMRYSLMNGGKRVRPLLVYAACDALGGTTRHANAPACAVELIHAYSLVHDDLPAMDDDDLRRGQPTTHKAFDQAHAILAGDALQSLAFEVLARAQEPLEATLRLQMLSTLAQAVGAVGMVGGQAIDLAAVGQRLDQEALERMHRHKTGALIEASVRLGALASGLATPTTLAALQKYAEAIGLAFQVQDDILDVTAETATLGKCQGADIARDKPTYVACMGLAAAQAYVLTLRDKALQALSIFDQKAGPLRYLAEFIVRRSY